MLLEADNVAACRQCCSMQTIHWQLWKLCLIPSLQAWEWAQLLTHVPTLADVPGPVIGVWQVVPLNPTLQEHCPRLLHCCEIELKISQVSIYKVVLAYISVAFCLIQSILEASYTVCQDCYALSSCKPTVQTVFYFPLHSWRWWCHTEKLYESRWEAIFSNAQCKVSFILPAQHINFILLHLQNIAELYVGSWQYLHI